MAEKGGAVITAEGMMRRHAARPQMSDVAVARWGGRRDLGDDVRKCNGGRVDGG